MIAKSFDFPVRVYYEDTDAGGVVYHANYLKFMERARSEFLIELGYSVVVCEQQYGVLFVVKNIQIDFAAAAILGDQLSVQTKVLKLGKVGMTMQQDIYNTSDNNQGLLICSSLVKLASVKKTVGQNSGFSVTALPPELAKQLKHYI